MLNDYTRHLTDSIRFEAYAPEEYDSIKQVVYDFCLDDDLPTHSVKGWESNGASLLNVMYIQKRFDTGILTIGYENDIPVCLSGCHDHPDLGKPVAIIGSRTLIKGHEHMALGLYLTGIQSLWLKNNGYTHQVACFNEHNVRLMNVHRRRQIPVREKMLRHNLHWPEKVPEYRVETLYYTEQHTLTYEL